MPVDAIGASRADDKKYVEGATMQAWRVHEFGEPAETFVLDEIAEPSAVDLEGLGMGLPGWIPLQPGTPPFDDWVIMHVTVAGLALPDVTMCRGTYPVPVARRGGAAGRGARG